MLNKSFPHLMLQEIFEQPSLLDALIQKNKKQNLQKLQSVLRVKDIKYFLFLACGTSYNASLFGSYVFEELLGIQSEIEYADQFIKRKAVVSEDTVVLAISQSGETGDVLQAVLKAKEKKALIVGIANNKNSSLVDVSDIFVYLNAGKEEALEASKTYTLDLFVLLNLALSLLGDKKLYILEELQGVPKKQKSILEQSEAIKKIAKNIQDKKSIAILGSKFNYATALEGSQKFEEATYILTKGYTGEEFRHGPKAIIEPGTLSIIIAPKDSVFKRNLKVIEEINNAGGEMIIITDKKGAVIIGDMGEKVIIPEASELLFPFLSILPLQLLAYYTSILKGIDVDSPRNLEKFIK
jgi:glucosamine--fructose-6-phosphate aminotransferase (isomerizing)